MEQQSVQAVKLLSGKTAVVLGCPGGRVRVLTPDGWRTSDASSHVLGGLEETQDFGFGGSALAVRHEVIGGSSEQLVIWFGTVSHPPSRPAHYTTTPPTGALEDADVATGAVHRLTWIPGQGFTASTKVTLHPTTAKPRGAYGVVGLCLTDLDPLPGGMFAGKELIVGTMSGDLIVLDADTMVEQWRTHVDGAIGWYNSIIAADLNNNGKNEVYAAGSKGLWRFKQQGE
ncbi:MAG TPA: hypothetical protein VF384_14695 [Planctomycetota bacterium]